MRAAEVWEIARRRLTGELRRELPEIVVFVADEEVIYGTEQQVSVARPGLFDLDSDRWEQLLEPRPSWIHFNLIDDGAELVIVTVRRSRASISPDDPHRTAVNVSVEPRRVIFIEPNNHSDNGNTG